MGIGKHIPILNGPAENAGSTTVCSLFREDYKGDQLAVYRFTSAWRIQVVAAPVARLMDGRQTLESF